jgi:hypothetical protein
MGARRGRRRTGRMASGAGQVAATRGPRRAIATRGVGRLTAMALALVVVAFLLLAAEARAGTYRVAQCGWGAAAELDPTYPFTEGTAVSLDLSGCTGSPTQVSGSWITLTAGVAADGAAGLARARWVAPPGTSFAAAHLIWWGTPQSGSRIVVKAEGPAAYQSLGYAFAATSPTLVDAPLDGGTWAVEAFIECLLAGPPIPCARSAPSVMYLSGINFTLEDAHPPQVRLGGSLASPGWHRGTASLELGAEDVGAGLVRAAATLDGTPVISLTPACAVRTIEGEARATKMQPCPPAAAQSIDVDTTHLADGPHALHACATDFTGDESCAPDAEIDVDNSPPTTSFIATEEGEVAAAVSDRVSGPATGTISVRKADTETWTDLATDFDGDGDAATLTARLPTLGAGTYFVRAVATDAAGNGASAQIQASGSAAEVRRQVAEGGGSGGGDDGGKAGGAKARAGKESTDAGRQAPDGRRATHLIARLATVVDGRVGRASAGGSRLTVDYGSAVEVRGRLTAHRGAAVGGRPVIVVARGAAGVGASERRQVDTDDGGHFELRLPAGTSRRVEVSFHGGGGLAPAPRRSLALRVRAAISLAVEPTELETGESVRLHGRVRLGPARVSGRGKIVAIQYLERATGRWRPALVVRTDAKGRFDTRYRFRYVTGLAEIRLRATAPAEGGWPFARGSSAPVTVTVRGR